MTESEQLHYIEVAAADWMARRQRGLTPRESTEYSEWVDADSRHRRAVAELERTWAALDRLAEADATTRSRWETAIPRVDRSSRRLRWSVAALAAAASLAIGYLGWWRPAPNGNFGREIATVAGEQTSLALPDGSTVRVNTATTLRIDYTAAERRVLLLHGEAQFAVAKNPARPFVVQAGRVRVRAVGTEFNVRRRSHAIDVLVTEGRVQVTDTAAGDPQLLARGAHAEPLLAAGERASIPVADDIPAPTAVQAEALPASEITRLLAWRERRLVFDETPLTEVIAEFNRYNRHQLVLADPRLATRRFGGSFSMDHPEAFVRLLETRFQVRAEHRSGATYLHLDEVPENSQ